MTTEEFDLSTATLEPGTTSLEASAGTGKTYTITGLVIRLIAELDFDISEVLVVTFTEAATDELRSRIRAGLQDAALAIAGKDSSAERYLERYSNLDSDERSEVLERLQRALARFDQATITTIHGFCHRVLSNDPIRTDAPVAFDLVGDQSELVHRAFEACWREVVYDADAELLGWFEIRSARANLGKNLGKWLRFPELGLHPLPREREEVRSERRQLWRDIVASFHQNADTVFSKIGWQKAGRAALGIVEDTDREQELQTELKSALETPTPSASGSYLVLRFLSVLGVPKKHLLKKSQAALSDEPLLLQAQRLAELLDEELHAMLPWMRDRIHARLSEEKEERASLSFHDLITKVATALQRPEADRRSELAETLGQAFRAALIDEFQDTDALQWSIFREIFGDQDHHLFLIGDPKQAIYGFRGADLLTYDQAIRTCDRRFTLARNYRSSPGMVRAAQSVFTSRPNPFVAEIDLPDVGAAREELGECEGPGDAGPLHFVATKKGQDLAELSADLVARHLHEAHLPTPNGQARQVRPEDCAILVRSNDMAVKVREALEARGIPTRTRKLGSLIESPFAHEVLALARAIEAPNDLRRVRRLWASPLCGAPPNHPPPFEPSELEIDSLARILETSRTAWRREGFVPACEAALEALRSRTHLAALPNAERILTDVDHLIEWFGSGRGSRLCDADRLARRLAEALDPEIGQSSEIPPRLASERGVQVMTTHAAKGLQFELVFLPELGAPAINRGPSSNTLHRARIEDRNVLTHCQLGGESSVRAVESVNLEEELRLAYVALTRAVRRTVVVLRIQESVPTRPLSAAQHLFMDCDASWVAAYGASAASIPAKSEPAAAAKALEAVCHYWTAETSHGALQGFNDPGLIPTDSGGPELRARPSHRGADLPPAWRRTSFTSLTSDESSRTAEVLPAFAESSNEDAGWEADEAAGLSTDEPSLEPSPEASEPSGLFAFAAGAGPGQLLHDLIESMDFDDPRGPTNRGLAERLLRGRTHRGLPLTDSSAHRAPIAPIDVCLDLCERVSGISWPVPDGSADGRPMDEDLAAEWRFSLHADGDIESALAHALDDGVPGSVWSRTASRLTRLPALPLRGFLTGSIDRLVMVDQRVLVVDWKSNLLGDAAAAYTDEALDDAMVDHLYPLQAALYELAVFRFLRTSRGETGALEALGGSCYVFLRGLVSEDSSRGLWFASPDFGRVRRLDQVLGPSHGEVALGGTQ